MNNIIFNYGYHKIYIVPFPHDGKTLWVGATYSHVKMGGVKTKPRASGERCIVSLLKNIDKGVI